MISDILEISKIEMGQADLRWEDVSISALVQDVMDRARAAAEKNSNRLEAQIAPGLARLRTDPDKLQKVLYSTVENACKFTSNGVVTVEAVTDADRVLFRVRDTGIGMTAEQAARVFEPFTQADDSATREHSGAGLGLTLTRQYCRLLQGDISVQSEPGQGATFTISLPHRL
jgi:signal transduction histidine kinase